MYCPNCGSENSEQMKFCQNCGALLNASEGNSGAIPAPGAAISSGGLVEATRKLINSPVYLVAVIGLTTQVGLSILASFAGYSQYSDDIYDLFINSGLSEELGSLGANGIYNIMHGTNVLLVVLSNLPTIAICIGLWILFSQAHNPTKKLETTGLTVIRIVVIIRLVLFVIICAMMVVSVFIAVAMSGGYLDDVLPVIIGIILGIAIVGTLFILYYRKVLKMIDSGKAIITTGNKTAPAYLFVIVLTFIAAGINCLTALSSLATQGIFAFLVSAASAVSGIGFGLLMNKYNKLEEMQAAPGQINVSINLQGNAPYRAQNIPQAPDFGNSPFNAPNYNPAQQIINAPKPGTTVLGYDEEEKKRRYANEGTMVLSDNFDMPRAKLIRMRDQKEILITKPSFTIGKAYGDVDYFIEDNPAISRKHALIALNEGKFYVMDTKSTNHTFVDGQQIAPETPTLLTDGAKIRFADEIYQFREG